MQDCLGRLHSHMAGCHSKTHSDLQSAREVQGLIVIMKEALQV